MIVLVITLGVLAILHRDKLDDAETDTVTVVDDSDYEGAETEIAEEASVDSEPKPSFSEGIVLSNPDMIPDYVDDISVALNGNIPNFTDYEITTAVGEHYSALDKLGRCGSAYAMIDESLMPTEERGAIGQIKPSGWNQEKYPGLVDSDPPYLYNRCHLIAYSLTGENANECNLITGTRYFNANGMLSYEMEVLDYVRETGNRVLYRVTPYFKGKEMVARGVEMEAYSVEDQGAGICFHVFVYNIQPGIEIDYRDGSSKVRSEN